ncbi:MAG: hypothetical protein CL610_15080 [Anaerolineaceae bacterium]|nr:hypothetical protein [Anaerolineaceae bacterium]
MLQGLQIGLQCPTAILPFQPQVIPHPLGDLARCIQARRPRFFFIHRAQGSFQRFTFGRTQMPQLARQFIGVAVPDTRDQVGINLDSRQHSRDLLVDNAAQDINVTARHTVVGRTAATATRIGG